jgi:hypothetical protein
MGRLIAEALYSNEAIEEHRLRARRQIDSVHRPGLATDVESLQDNWERAAERAREVDPDGSRSYALLRQMTMRSTQ